MQWVRVSLILAASALALALFLPETLDDPFPPAPPPAPSLPNLIRTDLNDYLWPTDAGYAVTSTFGEYRRTHFHGGIDIGTGDVTGYRVVASRAGEVARVTISPTGYGKILYIRHSDGYITTYAHLLGFVPAIERRVRADQERLERYPVTIEFARGELPVQKGELVAFTGESGSGSPHLHFEIRDESMEALNPMLAPGLRPPDDIPPAFRKIAFSPLTPGSTVNTSMDAVTMRVRMINQRSYTFPGPVTIVGAAGIGVYVRDRGNGTRYSRGAYRHRLFVDGRLRFEVRLDRVPMRESQQIGLYYIRDLLKERGGRFEKLYVNSRNDIPFLSGLEKGSGWLSLDSLPPGNHTVAILSQDFAGNTSQLTGTVTVTPAPPTIEARESGGRIVVTTSQPKRTTRFLVDARNLQDSRWSTMAVRTDWDSTGAIATIHLPASPRGAVRIRAASADGPWSTPAFVILRPQSMPAPSVRIDAEPVRKAIRITLSTEGIFSGSPSIAVEEGNLRRVLHLSPTDEHHCWTVFTPLDSLPGRRTLVFDGEVDGKPVRAAENIELFPILPGRKGSITADNGGFRLDYDSLSVYDTLCLQLRALGPPDSRAYELLPDGAVLKEGFVVTLRANPLPGRRAVFRRNGGDWALLGRPDTSSGGTRSARLTERLGTTTVLDDSTPPAIAGFRCIWKGPNRSLATFRVWDGLSGVDYKALKAYIDGKFVVPEIDGEHRRVTILSPEGLTRGPHHLQVRLQDNMGNPALLERGFAVP